jgi:hypothetical protein
MGDFGLTGSRGITSGTTPGPNEARDAV